MSASAYWGDGSNHLVIGNAAGNKKTRIEFGSNDNNTGLQLRGLALTNLFSVAGDGTVIVTPTGILQISSAGELSSSANISASAFFGDGSSLENVSATASPAGSDTYVQFNQMALWV